MCTEGNTETTETHTRSTQSRGTQKTVHQEHISRLLICRKVEIWHILVGFHLHKRNKSSSYRRLEDPSDQLNSLKSIHLRGTTNVSHRCRAAGVYWVWWTNCRASDVHYIVAAVIFDSFCEVSIEQHVYVDQSSYKLRTYVYVKHTMRGRWKICSHTWRSCWLTCSLLIEIWLRLAWKISDDLRLDVRWFQIKSKSDVDLSQMTWDLTLTWQTWYWTWWLSIWGGLVSNNWRRDLDLFWMTHCLTWTYFRWLCVLLGLVSKCLEAWENVFRPHSDLSQTIWT